MDAFKKNIATLRNLERILDNLRDGIIAHDLKRHIFFFNRQAEIITGYSRDEVLGLDCHEAFKNPFCGKQCSFCADEPLLKDTGDYSINITTKDGETRQVEITATMMKDEKGEDFGVLASFRDVTDILNLKMKAKELTDFSNIIGQNHRMLRIFEQIREVAVYDTPVHIHGETGTGKELVAKAIHDNSQRKGAPFVPINCGALPEGLVESELFGHIKGSFSGAVRDKKGRFQLADGGTIFLDEIAELPKDVQVKLLRFLQDGTFEPVGSEKTVTVDVRIISATNKSLKDEVENGNFREDLYYRVNVIPVRLPPLRDKKDDIPLLVDHFIKSSENRKGQKITGVSDDAISVIMNYSWPGNVRELENAIQIAVIKCKKEIVTIQDLPLELTRNLDKKSRRGPYRKLDAESVKSTLIKTGGNKARAAKILDVGRATLYRFIHEHPEVVPDDL